MQLQTSDRTTPTTPHRKPIETWRRDTLEPDLWHAADGVIVNTAALVEREFYVDVVRLEPYTR